MFNLVWGVALLIASGEICTCNPPKSLSLILLQDFSLDDFDLVRPSDVNTLFSLLPNEGTNFRSSSPDTVPSQASFLTGKFPSELNIYKSLGSKKVSLGKTRTVFQELAKQGYRVGHFGLWPFQEHIGDLTTRAFVSDDFREVVSKAKTFLTEMQDDKVFLSIWLPRIDATFNVGGSFSDEDWNAGFGGVQERKVAPDGNCPDTFRGDGKYRARYKTCPRQIYRANRSHEIAGLNGLLKHIRELQGSKFIAVSSTNGGESEQAEGHSRSRSTFRGTKRSLYEGGIRVPFRFYHSAIKPRAFPYSIASVDVLPTLLSVVGVTPQSEFDGISWGGCLLAKTSCENVKRQKPLMFEWRYSVPGHCMHESPRFAIIMGNYKLLMEDGTAKQMELYDLSGGSFEKTNLVGAVLKTEQETKRVEEIRETMRVQLAKWIRYVGALADDNEPESLKPIIHKQCRSSLATQDIPNDGVGSGNRATQEELKSQLDGIIFIVADDMGPGDLSFYHGDRDLSHSKLPEVGVAFEPSTSEFDRFASKGFVMNHFYANSAVCSPSRASFLTGRLPSQKHIRFHNVLDKKTTANQRRGVPGYLGENIDFKDKLTTMTRFFSDNGFITGHFGKWHLGYKADKTRDVNGALYGLDEYQIYGGNTNLWNPSVQFPTASKKHPNYLDNADFDFSSYVQDALVNRTIDFLKDRVAATDKFFVNVWLQNPHAPLNLATTYDQAGENGYPSSKNPLIRPSHERKPSVDEYLPLQIYRALLRDQERHVMRLVQAVDDLGISEKVLIVYTADNGPEERVLNFATVGSADPFRGRKRSLYEGGIRVPFIASWKGHIPQGRLSTLPASGIDLFPTFASLAGLKSEFSQLPDIDNIQGRDLHCLFLGSCADRCNGDIACDQEVVGDADIFFEYRDIVLGDCLSIAPRFAIRLGKYKLLWEPMDENLMYPKVGASTRRLELYDLIADPLEFTNLIQTQAGSPSIAAVANDLKTRIVNYIHGGKYDKTYTPAKTFNKARYDQTNEPFHLTERCIWKDTRPPPKISVSAEAVSRVKCSLDFLCNGQTPPTYPPLLKPTWPPSTGGSKRTEAPSSDPKGSNPPANRPTVLVTNSTGDRPTGPTGQPSIVSRTSPALWLLLFSFFMFITNLFT